MCSWNYMNCPMTQRRAESKRHYAADSIHGIKRRGKAAAVATSRIFGVVSHAITP